MTSCICGQSTFTEHQYVVCNNCQRLIHLECANLLLYQAKEIYIFYCQFCRPYTGPSIVKTSTNSHRHDRNEDNSDMLPIQTGTPDFINYLKKNTSLIEPKPGEMRKMRGQQLTVKELVISGFDKPILIESKDGLEISTEQKFTVDTLMQYYPAEHCVEVTEVTRQIKVNLKLTYLLAQFAIIPTNRQDVFALKLDLSQNTKLNDSFEPPRIVRKLSWVDQYWPNVPFKPALSKYCYFFMENSFTDFHIDFGGTSAWYHVMNGEQIFYLVEPTKVNLDFYQEWVKSSTKETIFFTKAEKMFKTKVSTGQTIFIPNGWIYATLSMKDSLVFGGYFLHSLSISTQLNIYDYLQKLEMPEFEFPSYELTNWYAAPNILKMARESFKNQPPRHLSEGIEALVEKLRYWFNKSKIKRNENLMIVPKAINCARIIRDLNHCLRNTKKKTFVSKDKEQKPKLMSPIKSQSRVEAPQETEQIPVLDPEETRIRDLVKPNNMNNGSKNTDGEKSSSLKLTFNMKLAQDVIRRSLDDPFDINGEHGDELVMLEKPSKSKKKRKRKDEEEIAKMIEGRPQDENYIYLDIETPEENSEAIKRSGDQMWQPGTSGKKSSKTKVKKISNTSGKQQQQQTNKVQTTTPSTSRTSTESKPERQTSEETTGGEKFKKPKKGLATPKQRLAKKLKMSM